MSQKLTLTRTEFRPLKRNTLIGFANVAIAELKLEIKDIAVYEKAGKRWAQLPAKPEVRDGALVKGGDGRIAYVPIMSFTTRAVADAFSAAVIRAVLELFPESFDSEERVP